MAATLEEAIHTIIEPLVEHPDDVIIREIPNPSKKDRTILIAADDKDTARLIGKKGIVANALREVVSIAGKADNSNTRIHLRFESLKDNDEEEAE